MSNRLANPVQIEETKVRGANPGEASGLWNPTLIPVSEQFERSIIRGGLTNERRTRELLLQERTPADRTGQQQRPTLDVMRRLRDY